MLLATASRVLASGDMRTGSVSCFSRCPNCLLISVLLVYCLAQVCEQIRADQASFMDSWVAGMAEARLTSMLATTKHHRDHRFLLELMLFQA
ncbi:hypothetical protein EDB19DRAFT_420371 [Suillus lakei]|nr:hypothetical protein EDB19DRAFT_420371 [Suillus lakei]